MRRVGESIALKYDRLKDHDLNAIFDAFSRSAHADLSIDLGADHIRLSAPNLKNKTPATERTVTVHASRIGYLSYEIANGQSVAAGAIIGRIRGISAEAEIRAPVAGIISEVHGSKGAFVGYGDPLLEISPAGRT